MVQQHSIQPPVSIPSRDSYREWQDQIQTKNPREITQRLCLKTVGQIKGKNVVTNLLFYTEYTSAWHSALCKHYKHVTKRGICKGRQLYMFEDGEKN